jgi:hypothetical protein
LRGKALRFLDADRDVLIQSFLLGRSVVQLDTGILLGILGLMCRIKNFLTYTLSPAEAEFDGLTARSETIQLCL